MRKTDLGYLGSNDASPPLDEVLDELSRTDRFEPPAGFASQAQIRDPAVYDEAADGPVWWAGQARQRLVWDTPFAAVLDDSNPPFFTWVADGQINASYNCLDRHVLAGRGDRIAFHWRGEEGEEADLSYAGILGRVQRLAGALRAQGVTEGNVVGIYLPMIPEVVVAMLACATTTAMVFDLDPDRDVFWCTADVGWITGHSYIVYGPMANGCTSVMFEGAPGYPDKDVWWEIVERYGDSILYTAPTAIRACVQWGAEYPGRRDLSSLRLLGSRPRAARWAMSPPSATRP